MAQKLSPADLEREVHAVFALIREAQTDLFCRSRKGTQACSRHKNHNGKHAAAAAVHRDRETHSWYVARVGRW